MVIRPKVQCKPVLDELEGRLTPANTPPVLVQDINLQPGSQSSELKAPTDVNGLLFFTANTPETGFELWKSDGTSNGTVLVRDIRPGAAGSFSTISISPPVLANINGLLFFTANDGVNGYELWRSDGTSSGTSLVRKIGFGTYGSGIKEIVNVNGTLFFNANNTLWKSDGTSSGTSSVPNLPPGNSFPQNLTNHDGMLYFCAFDSASGFELWKSNGMSSGTGLLRDIQPGAGGAFPRFFTSVGGQLFFSVNDGIHGEELWRSNGTSSGTVLVSDILPGTGNSYPRYLTNANGKLYFAANDGVYGYELWCSDGTSSGTSLVCDISPGPIGRRTRELMNGNGVLYFRGNDGIDGYELWRSDGTSSGTRLVRNIRPGTGYFTNSDPGNFTTLGGLLYFQANDGSNGMELWRSDGTSSGTTLVRDIRPGFQGSAVSSGGTFSQPTFLLTRSGSRLFLRADNGTTGAELWSSDGTSSGTALVRDVYVGPGSSSISQAVNVAGILYFRANDGLNGFELWRSDGTSSGTMMVRDILPGAGSSVPLNLTAVGNLLYFSANDGTTGIELWSSDGTSSGTVLVSDAVPGAGSSGPADLTNVNGLLLFRGSGSELWRSDGAASGTFLVRDIFPGSGNAFPGYLTNLNGVLCFRATDGVNGDELWRSDGTSSGTTLVRDIRPGPVRGNPSFLANVGGLLYFSATDGVAGYELWRSDGTSSGTFLVQDIQPGSASSYPILFTEVNGQVFFRANDGGNGSELWESDGTSSGTTIVRDIATGPSNSVPLHLTNIDGILYFRASSSMTGTDVWKSDGTSTGTVVLEAFADAGSSLPTGLTNVEGTLYFNAFSNSNGYELWKSDGTAAGTTVVDIEAGTAANPTALLAIQDRLFFAANRSDTGSELFTLRDDTVAPTVSAIGSLSPNGTYTTGQSVSITVQFSEPVVLAGGNLLVTLDTGAVVALSPFSGANASGIYIVQAGETSPDLNVTGLTLGVGATLKDALGNTAVLTLPLSNLANNANILVNPAAPTTLTYTVNLGATQRSRLTVLELTFGTAVDAAVLSAPGAIAILRTTPNDAEQVVAANGLFIAPATGMVTNLSLTFANMASGGINHASLADGRWRLVIPGLSYQSPLNDPTLRRLFGDADANGTVDGSDFSAFGSAFGSTGADNPFDFDNNSTIDGLDFAAFGARFGVTL